MTSMAREAVTTSYITTKLRRIPNGLLGSNQRTSLSHEHLLPSFPLYIYIYIFSPGFRAISPELHPPSFELGSRKWEIGRNRITTSPWRNVDAANRSLPSYARLKNIFSRA